MSLLDTILDKAIEIVNPTENTEIVLEGYDPLNRKVQAIKTGKKYKIVVDDFSIDCDSAKAMNLEFEYRINNSNRNF